MKTIPPFLHLLVVLLITGCAGTGPEGEADHSGLSLTEDASLATLRPALRGTMSRSYLGQMSTMPFVDHQLVDLWWSELEASGTGTTSGGYFAAGTRDWKKLETALASGIKVRLRIHAGRHAPQYVKRMGFEGGYSSECPDGGIYLVNAYDNVSSCVPKFWRPQVLARYEALLEEVNRRHGANPNLYEVVNSACMTTYAEPFYRAHRDGPSNQRLIEAGLTEGKDLYCHQQAILIHSRVFPQIRTSLAVNPWDLVDPNDTTDHVRMSWTGTFDFLEGSGDSTYLVTWDGLPTTTLWNGARGRLGNRLTLQNNGLGENEGCFLTGGDTLDNAKKSHLCYLSYIARTTTHSVGFQTETMARLREDVNNSGVFVRSEAEGVRMALDAALALNASFVELPAGFQNWTHSVDIQMLQSKDAALTANAP
jgi:hypothetical protein